MRHGILIVVAALTAVFGVTPLAWAQGYGHGSGMLGGWGWGADWSVGMIGMLLWWVLIILAITILVRWLISGAAHRGHPDARDRSLDILKERYARGEIDKKEFEDKKRDLLA